MATFAVGDVHGCFDSLEALLARTPFDATTDRLWLVGDLFNRGPRPLATLRWARERAERLGERFRTVLGNHDLHLLRRAEGLREPRPRDTLEPILEAPDGAELVEWVAGLPLLHRERIGRAEATMDVVLVHAGLWPEWTPEEAERRARAAEAYLRDPATRRRALATVPFPTGRAAVGAATAGAEGTRGGAKDGDTAAGDGETAGGGRTPGGGSRSAARSREVLSGTVGTAALDLDASRRSLFAFTELRTLRPDGSADPEFSGSPADAPPERVPWYRAAGRRSAGALVVFGHWSALGYHRGDGVLALDTGAVWGQGLTAVRLEDGATWFQPTVEPRDRLPRGGPA